MSSLVPELVVFRWGLERWLGGEHDGIYRLKFCMFDDGESDGESERGRLARRVEAQVVSIGGAGGAIWYIAPVGPKVFAGERVLVDQNR